MTEEATTLVPAWVLLTPTVQEQGIVLDHELQQFVVQVINAPVPLTEEEVLDVLAVPVARTEQHTDVPKVDIPAPHGEARTSRTYADAGCWASW